MTSTTPRRRVLRGTRPAPAQPERSDRRRQAQHAQLVRDQASLARWMTRLKRAFHTVEKLQRRIARAERQLAKLDER